MININLNSRTTDVVVIVVIVLVIAAVLFPILLPPPRSKSASSWCMFKLHTMGKAMHAYQDDWDGVFPDPSVAAVWGHGSRRTWTENLYHYHKDIEVYRCPTRKVNFAYAMNNRLGGDTPVMPTHCVFVYESPGCGNLNYRVDPEKDNWCVERGAEIGWATGNAGLSGSKVREVSEEVTFDDLSCAPQDTAKAKRKPTGSYADLVLPGPHSGSNCLLFCDGHTGSSRQWEPWRVTFDPSQENLPSHPDAE